MNHWKINFVILLITSTVVTISMLLIGMNVMKDLQLKEGQINVLIDEVGNLRSSTTQNNIATAPADAAATTGRTSPMTLAAPTAPHEGQEVILIVGQHSQLTDTIMLAVVDHTKKAITLISIPRDFAIQGRKINEFYEFFGIKSLANQITTITNIVPSKFVIVSMDAFQQFIDAIGGIDVTIEKGLADYTYPTANRGVETFSIGAGIHHLDGEIALKYARSRHSTSDFDRAKRQQQVVSAVKERLKNTWSEDIVNALRNLYIALSHGIETNVTFTDALSLYYQTRDYAMQTENVFSTENLLYSTYNAQGQYILLPKDKTYDQIQAQVRAWLGQ